MAKLRQPYSTDEGGLDVPGVDNGGDNLYNANTQPGGQNTGTSKTQPVGSPQTLTPDIPPPATSSGTQAGMPPLAVDTGNPTTSYTANATYAPTTNKYGTSANLDPTYLHSTILSALQKYGKPTDESNIQYWIDKASTPDQFSNNQWGVGWNPYREAQMAGNPTDPSLYGNDWIQNPGQYGLQDTAGGGGGNSSLSSLLASLGGGTGANTGVNDNGFSKMITELLGTHGGMNTDLMNKQVVSARDAMEGQRKMGLDTLDAQLAERGLKGGGAETSALGRMDTQLGGQLGQNITDIYTNESNNANDRLKTALGLAGSDVASQRGAATTMRGQDITQQLGLGNLALGNLQNETDWNKFLATFGLSKEKTAYDMQNGNTSNLLSILQLILGIQGQQNQGHL